MVRSLGCTKAGRRCNITNDPKMKHTRFRLHASQAWASVRAHASCLDDKLATCLPPSFPELPAAMAISTRGFLRPVCGQEASTPTVATGNATRSDEEMWKDAMVSKECARGTAGNINVELCHRKVLAHKMATFCNFLT